MRSIEKQHAKVLKEFGDYSKKKKKFLKKYAKLSSNKLEKNKLSFVIERKLSQKDSGQIFWGRTLTTIGIFLGIASFLPDDELSRNLKASTIILAFLALIISGINKKEDRSDLIRLLELDLKVECINIILNERVQKNKEIIEKNECTEDQITNEFSGNIEILEDKVEICDFDQENLYSKEEIIRKNNKLIKAKENGVADAQNTISIIISALLGVVLSFVFTSGVSSINEIIFYIIANYNQLMFGVYFSMSIILLVVWVKILFIDEVLNFKDKHEIEALSVENENYYKDLKIK
ncbi:hypothetical protein [Acetobacterium malicum]|uniref:hypothetical protein n=1 Tax=Acetobacterium malicum TaxID=52692 RepID=UPI000415FEDA|nr:hypothetical protein [Acetobacterium dehalogenans]